VRSSFVPSPDLIAPPVEVIEIEARRALHGHFNVIHVPTSLKADIYPAGAPRGSAAERA